MLIYYFCLFLRMGRVVEKAFGNHNSYGRFGPGSGNLGARKGTPRRGPADRGYKLTLAQQARTMSYYQPTPKQENFLTADRALFILGPDNTIRKFAKRIIEWPYPFLIMFFFFFLYL